MYISNFNFNEIEFHLFTQDHEYEILSYRVNRRVLD